MEAAPLAFKTGQDNLSNYGELAVVIYVCLQLGTYSYTILLPLVTAILYVKDITSIRAVSSSINCHGHRVDWYIGSRDRLTIAPHLGSDVRTVGHPQNSQDQF